MIRQSVKDPEIKVGNLNTRRDFTYVEDTTEAMIIALQTPNIEGEIINIGTSKTWKMKEILNLIKKETKTEHKKVVLDKSRLRLNDVDTLVADSEKARKILNWKPKITLNEGIGKTLHGSTRTIRCGDTKNAVGGGDTKTDSLLKQVTSAQSSSCRWHCSEAKRKNHAFHIRYMRGRS